MNAERDELIQIIWDGAVADRVKDGKAPHQVPVVRPKVEAMADAILGAGYSKVDARPACPPRVEGGKPHCPDCSGIVGETGVVW